jgi:putative selenate reductase
MSEIMRPLPFAQLMETALGEYLDYGSVFGVRKQKFYRDSQQAANAVCLFGSKLDTPVGPAAGPHSQLANNIIASYLAGSRFIEVKTVQIMDGDELRAAVARPCINATDECYNVEWSTELTVEQALEEYVKAWVAVHVLGKEFGLGTGVIFNMSVGYNLEGIKSAKIDRYIEGMKDASGTAIWQECQDWLAQNISRFSNFNADDLKAISPTVSNSITVSTLHGCPADEIERIAAYLLTEKHLHTYVKCNPTLLGYATARELLDNLGFGYVAFDEHHFLEDLQFADATQMFKRLLALGSELGLAVGAKITNTFPVEIHHGELPGEEMYMSGRPLFPLSLTVASRLSEALDGQLPISYSGGIDAFNVAAVLATGIRPLTVATTVLKPGGYERMQQLATLACEALAQAGSAQLPPEVGAGKAVDVKAIAALATQIAQGDAKFARHHKDYREASDVSSRALPLFSCASAPCSGIDSNSGCPINQQIPLYLAQVAAGDNAAALQTILTQNVLPSTTGTICNHRCQSSCMRLHYDDSLNIRAAKQTAVQASMKDYLNSLNPSELQSDAKVLVIGAGAAGLATASYLRRNGVQAEVRETRKQAMGIVSHVIPDFRISDEQWQLDASLAQRLGVQIGYGAAENYNLNELKQSYDYIIIATGAWEPGRSSLALDGQHTLDALDFLARSRTSQLQLPLGKRVAVIGGGDVAMDCARAAARNAGVEETVLVYRRTLAQMPAQREELQLALADGVKVLELHQPTNFANGTLTCEIMQLGSEDASGRRAVTGTGQTVQLDFDTVVSAVGAGVGCEQFVANGIALNAKGLPELGENLESSVPGVYIVGDCKAGPATVVQAMADAKLAAANILAKLGLSCDFVRNTERDTGTVHLSASQQRDTGTVHLSCLSREQLLERKGILQPASANAATDAARCLGCNQVCEVCVDVCPNRANVAISLPADAAAAAGFGQTTQVIHIDRLCNECGNCAIFCPSAGKPYLDKFTLFANEEDMADSKNNGYLPLPNGQHQTRIPEDACTKEQLTLITDTIASNYSYITV